MWWHWSEMEVAALAEPAPSLAEEVANTITHALGFVLSLIGFGALLAWAVRHPMQEVRVGCAVFGATLALCYGASTFYHAWRTPRIKYLLRILDHIAIYLLIAGSYTPFVVAYFSDGWRITILCLVWGMAAAGTIFKLFFTGRYPLLSTATYVVMGWAIVIALEPLVTSVPAGCLWWLGAGGAAYMVGVVFYLWERLPFNHAVWHLFVLAGSLCHYIAVVRYVV